MKYWYFTYQIAIINGIRGDSVDPINNGLIKSEQETFPLKNATEKIITALLERKHISTNRGKIKLQFLNQINISEEDFDFCQSNQSNFIPSKDC